MIIDLGIIANIFPFGLKTALEHFCDRKSIHRGSYDELDSMKSYYLWTWGECSFLVPNPDCTDEFTVFPPHPESVFLADLIPESKGSAKFLDVGVGSGILSIIAAQRGWDVVGVDVNDEAIQLATINSKLNDVRCNFKNESLAKNEIGERFKLCIANLPFEPTPENATNFLHSDGGLFGDTVINEFLEIVEEMIDNDGVVIVPSFSLYRKGKSRLEELLIKKQLPNMNSCILRISDRIDLKFLSVRFAGNSKAYDYLESQGYADFVIDVAFLKKTPQVGRFNGVCNIHFADKTWIMPIGWKGIGRVEQ